MGSTGKASLLNGTLAHITYLFKDLHKEMIIRNPKKSRFFRV